MPPREQSPDDDEGRVQDRHEDQQHGDERTPREGDADGAQAQRHDREQEAEEVGTGIAEIDGRGRPVVPEEARCRAGKRKGEAADEELSVDHRDDARAE